MKISVEEFQEAYKVLDRVDSHAGLLASQFVKLRFESPIHGGLAGLVISEVTIPNRDPGPKGEFYADRRILGAFLGTARAKTIELEAKDGHLHLHCGKQRAQIASMEGVSGYSSWKPSKEHKTLSVSDGLKQELRLIAQYAPITAAADHLSAVYLVKGYGILATDSFVMAVCLDAAVNATVPLPVVLTRVVSEMPGAKQVIVDKQGVGIQLPQGYLYQSTNTRLKEYPLKVVQELAAVHGKAKPAISFEGKQLQTVLEYLKGFVFGSDQDTLIECQAKNGESRSTLVLTLPQGNVRRRLDVVSVVQDCQFKWPLAPLLPWSDQILKDAQKVTCTHIDGIYGFRAVKGKKTYVLLVAERD